MMIAWIPEMLYAGGRFRSGMALACDDAGTITSIARVDELKDEKKISLPRRALLPGMVNAHSHAFQRVLRGRTEYRSQSFRGGLPPARSGSSPTRNDVDSFWTWREMMYSAAMRLTPDDIYDASRMAFLEMALSGITAVGEFHYLHHAPDGTSYDDPNLLAKEVLRAAGDVGLRIALLRVAYARSGFKTEANPQQVRFIESDAQIYLKNLADLAKSVGSPSVSDSNSDRDSRTVSAWIGVAPHSVRAVPLNYLNDVIA